MVNLAGVSNIYTILFNFFIIFTSPFPCFVKQILFHQIEEKMIINDIIEKQLWPLTPQEFNNLEQSILTEGCRENLILWNDTLIDGHNRYHICQKHNLPYTTVRKEFDSIEQVLKWIDMNQLSRRNITDEQRTILFGRISRINKMENDGKRNNNGSTDPMSTDQKSQQKSANELNVSIRTLYRAEQYLDAIEDLERNTSSKIINEILNGELKIAKKDVVKISKLDSIDQANVIVELQRRTKGKVKHQSLTEAIRNVKIKEKATHGKSVVLNHKLIDLRLGDFTEVLNDLPDNSVDLILTDPPYDYKYIDCWSKLAEFAEKKLVDGGFLICYSGQLYLPEVINRVLKGGLKCYWIGVCHHDAGVGQRFETNMLNRSKPILFFYKGNKRIQSKWLEDLQHSGNQDKDYHIWGQSTDVFEKIINTFEPKNVCDPFTGGGTTAIACLKQNIQFIGSEIEEQSYNVAKKRISDYYTESN